MNSLRVLREVTGADVFILTAIENEQALIERQDGSKWVDNDHPWDVGISGALGRHGGRFAVADEYNGIVAGPYKALDKAEKARASAKMTVEASVDVEDDEPAEPEVGPSAAPAGGGGSKAK